MASEGFNLLVEYMRKAPPPPGYKPTRQAMATAGLRNVLLDGLVCVPAEDAPLKATWLVPAAASDDVILYFHGGGFALGSVESHGYLAVWLAGRPAHAR